MSLVLQVLYKKLRNTLEGPLVGLISSSVSSSIEVSCLLNRQALLRYESPKSGGRYRLEHLHLNQL